MSEKIQQYIHSSMTRKQSNLTNSIDKEIKLYTKKKTLKKYADDIPGIEKMIDGMIDNLNQYPSPQTSKVGSK